MNLQQMRYFVMVARLGNVAYRAAAFKQTNQTA